MTSDGVAPSPGERPGLSCAMSKKNAKIAALIAAHVDRDLDPHYLGYFECFNGGQFYESHDVLEALWLTSRQGPNDGFYKGLIQLAGAFVHLQKHREKSPRLRPAAALFRLSRSYLAKYPTQHERLDIGQVLAMIDEWLGKLETGEFKVNPLGSGRAPRLELLSQD